MGGGIFVIPCGNGIGVFWIETGVEYSTVVVWIGGLYVGAMEYGWGLEYELLIFD